MFRISFNLELDFRNFNNLVEAAAHAKDQFYIHMIEKTLLEYNWNVTKAASYLNMDRSNFLSLMRFYGIKRPMKCP